MLVVGVQAGDDRGVGVEDAAVDLLAGSAAGVFVGISTHGEVPEVPNADVLLMAGTFAKDLELVRRLRARGIAEHHRRGKGREPAAVGPVGPFAEGQELLHAGGVAIHDGGHQVGVPGSGRRRTGTEWRHGRGRDLCHGGRRRFCRRRRRWGRRRLHRGRRRGQLDFRDGNRLGLLRHLRDRHRRRGRLRGRRGKTGGQGSRHGAAHQRERVLALQEAGRDEDLDPLGQPCRAGRTVPGEGSPAPKRRSWPDARSRSGRGRSRAGPERVAASSTGGRTTVRRSDPQRLPDSGSSSPTCVRTPAAIHLITNSRGRVPDLLVSTTVTLYTCHRITRTSEEW